MIKSSYKAFADNTLFALNIFIIVLVLAGDHLAIPNWLQPVGRLHPLLLHFPIVLLLLAMLMDIFRYRPAFQAEKTYQDMALLLWLSGALLAAITAIMGLFLSREPGYSGTELQWHRWLGVGIVFLATVIYVFRNDAWYDAGMAKKASAILALFLIIGGHLGGDLTHGEDFILAPVLKPKGPTIPIDQALVYRDVVQPIFESKCISCHNSDKMKGGLMLTEEKVIMKGGKDGRIIVPGQPQISLLLQRIHLQEDDKNHMPPVGKPQLSAAEQAVLYHWIKENASFNTKVAALPASDSLRLASVPFLKSAESVEEKYDFAAVDEKTIQKLNNNYRVIVPVAAGSPALAVDIYNRSVYTSKTLEDLSPIKKQIISLNLDKMPVKDEQLKTIAQFENLRTLNLDGTDITGNTLHNLSSLKFLRSLSLAGTRMADGAFDQLNSFKSLKQVVVWNTGLTNAQIAKLQSVNKAIQFIAGYKDNGKPMKLIPPQLKNTAFVFKEPVELHISSPVKGVDIRYTTDGSDPDSVKALVYKPGIMLSNTTTLKVRAYKAGWYGSDVVSASFYKNTFWPDSVALTKPVNEKYQADGAHTIIDGDLGGTNFGNNKWLGTQQDMEFLLFFKNPVKPAVLTLNCLKAIPSQIFLPSAIEIWGGADQQHLHLISTLKTGEQKKDDPTVALAMNCKLNLNAPVSCIKVIAKPIYKLPAWHPAKGKPSWVFVDEVLVN